MVTTEYLLSNGQVGAAVAYKQATKSQRIIYLDDSFVAQHPTISELLTVCGTQHSNRWRFLTSLAEVQEVNAMLVGKGRSSELFVMVSAYVLRHLPLAFSLG